MTRAKRHLSVIGRAYFKKDGTRAYEGQMGWIAPAAPASVAVRYAAPAEELVSGDLEVPALAEAESAPEPIAPLPAVNPLRGLRVSYSSLELHAACSLRYHLQVELGLRQTDVVIAGGGGRGLPGARAFGERFHEAIQHVDWRAPVLVWDDQRAQTLFATIRDGAIGARLAAAEEVHTEWPFLLGVEGTVVEGVADVWARESAGTVLIVDWKTGTLHAPDDRGYALQAEMHALAALRAGAERAETTWCHVVQDGVIVEGRYEPCDAMTLEAQALMAFSGIGTKPTPAVETAAPVCSRCPGLRIGCPVAASSRRPR